MVTTFDTTGGGGANSSSTGSGTKTLVTILVIAAVGFLAWKYVIKPGRDKKSQEKKK
jgi:hypothetical protein